MLLSLLIGTQIHAQEFDPYKIEEDGKIIKPQYTSEEILFTDNYSSSLYLLNAGIVDKIWESPNCGRYYQLSHDRTKVAFKFIDSLGRQTPTILDLKKRCIRPLHKAVDLCGQPVFWGKNNIAFSVWNSVFLISDEGEHIVSIPNYCNQIAVSPDGKFLVWNDHHQQLFLKDMSENQDIMISPEGVSCINPAFSPDGKKIVFNTLEGRLYVFCIKDEEFYEIGEGGNPVWISNSEQIIFEKSEIENFEILASDIFIADFKGMNIRPLTKTPNVFESQPSIDLSGRVLFSTLNNTQIFSAQLNAERNSLINVKLQHECVDRLQVRFYNVSKFSQNKSIIDLGEMPYVHQVYDTPDFHDGSGSCGATTAVMALAAFNIVPPWPTLINKLYIHENDYGSYVADKYHFNGNFFDTYTSPYFSDAWGAYSYMWASGSPSSTMRDYYSLHGLDASQSWTIFCSFNDTKNEIDAGYPHSICNYMTTAGHITLAKGYIENQHTLLFHDPYGDKNTPGYPSYDGANVFYDWPGYNNGYQNLDADGTHGGIAWSVTTHKNPAVYNDTIVDDLDFGHGFFIFNEPPSHMKYFRDQASGHKEHSWWTVTIDTGQDVCYVTWQPDITGEGIYEISAYIPAGNSNAQQSKYIVSTIMNTTEVVIDQSQYQGEWALLGYYTLSASDSCMVYLGDNTGIPGEKMAFDAIRFSRAPMVDISELSERKVMLFVYPNPVTDDFNIIFPETGSSAKIRIIDMHGKEVFSEEILPNQKKLQLTTKSIDLEPGIYLISLCSEVNYCSTKIIVE